MEDSSKDIDFNHSVKGVVIGDNNTVTIVYKNSKEKIIPFLAPPKPAYKLVGRENQLSDLKRTLVDRDGLSLCALSGIPGVGKTALAIEIANDREMLAAFPDGILWIGLGREPNLLDLLGKWCVSLGFPENKISQLVTIEQRIEKIRELINTKKMLLVIDDAWQLEAALSFNLGGPNCAQLLTTRFPEIAYRFAYSGALSIQELDLERGMELLEKIAPNAVHEEYESAKKLVEEVGGLPLSLIVLGNYLGKESIGGQKRRISQAIERLKLVQERLELEDIQHPASYHPSLPKGAKISLEAIIDISMHAMTEPLQKSLISLSVFPPKPNSFSEEAVLSVICDSEKLIDQLCDNGLVEPVGKDRYTVHQSIHDYSKMYTVDQDVYSKMINYYINFAKINQTNYSFIDKESTNITHALQQAAEKEYYLEYQQGVNAYYNYIHVHGLYHFGEELLKRGTEFTQTDESKFELIITLINLGRIYDKKGEYQNARHYYLESLKYANELKQYDKVVVIYANLGTVSLNLGDFDKADHYYREGLQLVEEYPNPNRKSALLLGLGAVADSKGQFKEAIINYMDSLAIAKEHNLNELIPVILSNLSGVYTTTGNYTEAEKYLNEGLTIARSLGYKENISLILSNLGMMAQKLEKYDQAREYYEEGLSIAREIGHPKRVCILLTNLGSLLGELGEYDLAKNNLTESLSIAENIGQRWDMIAALNQLGELYLIQENLPTAYENFNRAISIAEQIQSNDLLAEAMFGMARVLQCQGKIMDAKALAEKCLTIFKEMNNPISKDVESWLLTC